MRALYIVAALLAASPAEAARIKDLGQFAGIRTNQLVGYGIVVGLDGTGDDSLPYTIQSLKNAVSRLGLSLPPGINPALKNTAAVMLTAELPPFAKPGQRIDVTVSAIGKAKSLRGGTLLMAPLSGADGATYAIAQGSLAVGGLGAEGRDGSKITVNVPSAGRIPGGATVERMVDTPLGASPALVFNLADADFTNASRVAAAINARFGPDTARAIDAISIEVSAAPVVEQRVSMIAAIENLSIERASVPARVIVNARTGTIVIGAEVRIAPAAVSHGGITVRVSEDFAVSQPAPLARRGETAVTPDSAVNVEQPPARMFALQPGASLAELVRAINAVGAAPADLVAILEALKQAGALTADLVVI